MLKREGTASAGWRLKRQVALLERLVPSCYPLLLQLISHCSAVTPGGSASTCLHTHDKIPAGQTVSGLSTAPHQPRRKQCTRASAAI